MRRIRLSDRLISWYRENKRDLPWRQTRDPYKIWLSEILLQQTRVSQGLPYYYKFINNFPALRDLVNASEKEILRLWQGLGYYSRARNMHRCAEIIVREHQGIFPSEYDRLIKLPGIGPYTAAAIASITFDKPIPVLDGNVIRVLSRIFGILEDPQSGKGKKVFAALAENQISLSNPGEYNQAVMEFGALHCKPLRPACGQCTLNDFCYAYNHHKINELPLKIRKQPKKERFFNYLIIRDKGRIFLKERIKKDIWKGMYDFFMIETKSGELSAGHYSSLFRYEGKGSRPDYFRKGVKHVLTHQTIHANFFQCTLDAVNIEVRARLNQEGRFYNVAEIRQLPKPVLIENYLKEEIF